MSNIHDKIKKLLAMAEHEGGNDHEREKAMELASMLMMRHGIDRSALGDKATVVEGAMFTVDYKWYQTVAAAAGELYGTQPFYHNTSDVLRCRFVGRQENIDASQDTLAFLILQVEAAYKFNLPKGMSKTERAEYRRSFKNACAMRIYHRAHAIVQEQLKREADAAPKVTGTALVILEHREQLKVEIEGFFAAQSNVKWKKSRQVSTKINRGSLDGVRAGDTVDLNRKMGS